MNKKHILIIGLVSTAKGTFELVKLAKEENTIYSLLTPEETIIDEYKNYFSNIILIPSDYWSEYENIITKVEELNQKNPVSSLICLTDKTIYLASLIIKKLNIIGPMPNESIRVRNKYILRDILANNNLYDRYYKLITDDNDLKQVDESDLPLVAKPLTSSTSIMVNKIKSLEELANYYLAFSKNNPNQIPNEISKIYLDGKYQNKDLYNSFLLEDFIDGEEVSIEGIVADDKIHIFGITDKILSEPPYFVEIGHIFPSQKNNSTQGIIIDLVEKSIRATGLNNTGFHAEVRIKNNRADIIEINGRLGGGFIQNLIYLTKGYNTIKKLVDLSESKFNLFKENPHTYPIASTRYVIAQKEGILKSIDYSILLDKYSNNIKLATIDWKMGTQILLPPKNYERLRLGRVVFCGNSMEEIDRIAQDIQSLVKVTIK